MVEVIICISYATRCAFYNNLRRLEYALLYLIILYFFYTFLIYFIMFMYIFLLYIIVSLKKY